MEARRFDEGCFDGLTTEKHVEDEVNKIEVGGERLQRKNDKTRQFLTRTANQIFTSRELSSVEVCANLLGYPNSFSSQKTWQNIHMRHSTGLYFEGGKLFRTLQVR